MSRRVEMTTALTVRHLGFSGGSFHIGGYRYPGNLQLPTQQRATRPRQSVSRSFGILNLTAVLSRIPKSPRYIVGYTILYYPAKDKLTTGDRDIW